MINWFLEFEKLLIDVRLIIKSEKNHFPNLWNRCIEFTKLIHIYFSELVTTWSHVPAPQMDFIGTILCQVDLDIGFRFLDLGAAPASPWSARGAARVFPRWTAPISPGSARKTQKLPLGPARSRSTSASEYWRGLKIGPGGPHSLYKIVWWIGRLVATECRIYIFYENS